MSDHIDISEIDKSKFKCYKFPDGSIYYGEVAHTDDGNIVSENDLSTYNKEGMQRLRLVRHGIGVQLFDVLDTSCLCRYEGEWTKDKKNGQGICYYSDKSCYEGNFVNDLFDGNGKFIWPNNDIYIGMWKTGRMEGDGEFKHSDGHILRGSFRNNYYFDKDRLVFINPFLSSDQVELFKNKNNEYSSRMKLLNDKFSWPNIFRINSHSDLLRVIDESIKNNKTPLIVRTSENLIKKQDIYSLLMTECKEIDLRYFYLKLRQSFHNSSHVFEELSSIVVEALTKGYKLILNFDECKIKYEELFDPDIKEFYGNMLLSSFMWTPSVFSQTKCWQSHLKNSPDKKLHKNFSFIVYSKTVIDSNMQEHDLVNVIEKRFEKCFPLNNVNVLILSNFNKN